MGEYDPATALWGGQDGLDAIRVVEATARRLLRPGGLVAVEHGAQQGAAVYWVFAEESGWRETRNHCDLAGRDRFVTAARPWAAAGRGRMSGYERPGTTAGPELSALTGLAAAAAAVLSGRACRAAD